MVSQGERAPHKLSEAPSRVSCSKDICKRRGESTHSSPHGQCFSSKLHQQTRRDPLFCAEQLGPRPMDMVPSQPHQPHCTTYPRGDQYSSRLEVDGVSGCKRLETQFTGFCSPQQILGTLGIDLFASRLSRQLLKFVSWKPDPEALGTDAFTLDWNQWRGYAFPPFSLIGRCLRQVQIQRVAELVIVTPVWPAQAWNPLLLELCIDYPVLLPQDSSHLMRDHEVHPLGHLHLAGWIVSTDHSRRHKFLQRLGKYFCQPG